MESSLAATPNMSLLETFMQGGSTTPFSQLRFVLVDDTASFRELL